MEISWFAALVLFIASTCEAQATTSSAFLEAKHQAEQINRSLDKTNKVSWDVPAEHGSYGVSAFTKNDRLQKLVLETYTENGAVKTCFYYRDGALFYVVDTYRHFKRDHDGNIVSPIRYDLIQTEEYLFSQGVPTAYRAPYLLHYVSRAPWREKGIELHNLSTTALASPHSS